MLGGGRFGNQTDRRDQFMTSAGEKITIYLSLINSSTGKNEAKNGAIYTGGTIDQSFIGRKNKKKSSSNPRDVS
jgi:hypothetical protein